MNLTITGYSTALFSTWFFIEELGMLFDAGDGLCASLMQKSRKVRHAFISHADRDHLAGLLQFNQLNARDGFPIIYYPESSGSFTALKSFFSAFDPQAIGTVWKPIKSEDKIFVKNDLYVESLMNGHVPADKGIHKSLGYKVFKTKRKLKTEFLNCSAQQIKSIIDQHGKDYITDEVRVNVLSYSGDTPMEDYDRWNNTEILIHEATFIGSDDEVLKETQTNRHSTLEDVFKMAANINIGRLILSHFSTRYSPEQIDFEIKKLCKKYAIDTPVYRVLPGQIHKDILGSHPLN